MAQNGGRGLSITGGTQPTHSGMARIQTVVPLTLQRDLFTLSQSNSVRVQNEYVDVPIREVKSDKDEDAERNQTHYLVRLPERPRPIRVPEPPPNISNVHKFQANPRSPTTIPPFVGPSIVTTQPNAPLACKKFEKPSQSVLEQNDSESIICQHCGGCKCDSCSKPKRLPSTWILNKKCHCSADETVECCTCLCCVKGLFYHVSKDYEMDNDVECSDNPCSCAPYKRCLRWSSLGVLSLFLPCLCLYWPMHGCVKLLECCYSRYTTEGCHCSASKTLLPSKEPEKA